jgi:hypothetical protein
MIELIPMNEVTKMFDYLNKTALTGIRILKELHCSSDRASIRIVSENSVECRLNNETSLGIRKFLIIADR